MTYTSEEIRELLLYVTQTQKENEDLRAQLIALMAKLNNEESKVKLLMIQLKAYKE
jgi:uncharacterized coiled-coil protein SlyX